MVRTFVDSGLSIPTAKAMLYFLICFLAVPNSSIGPSGGGCWIFSFVCGCPQNHQFVDE